MKRVSACPAGCGREQQASRVMCRSCWFSVPRALRTPVWNSWNEYTRARHAGDMTQAHQALRRYRAAREAAIASAREHLLRKETKS